MGYVPHGKLADSALCFCVVVMHQKEAFYQIQKYTLPLRWTYTVFFGAALTDYDLQNFLFI